MVTSAWYTSYWNAFLLPPANEVCEGCFYRCLSVQGGTCMVAGGHVWLLGGAWLRGGWEGMVARGMRVCQRGMHGCWGVCVVAGGLGVWLLGGHAWLSGACMVAGGLHGCQGVVCGCGGACMVAGGGMCGCQGACVAKGGI